MDCRWLQTPDMKLGAACSAGNYELFTFINLSCFAVARRKHTEPDWQTVFSPPPAAVWMEDNNTLFIMFDGMEGRLNLDM